MSKYWRPPGSTFVDSDTVDKVSLAHKYPHPRDPKIAFTESDHRYYLCGPDQEETERLSQDLVSVTTLKHGYEQVFQPRKKAQEMAEKKTLAKNPKYAELLKNVPQQQWADCLVRKWENDGKEASELGTKMHARLEAFVNSVNSVNSDPTDEVQTEYEYGLQFLRQVYKQYSLVPYRTEWMVYTDDFDDVPTVSVRQDNNNNSENLLGPLRLCGSIDLVLAPESQLQNTGRATDVVICDWKRSKKLELIDRYKTMRNELSVFPGGNGTGYSIQVNTYKWILETCYGLRVWLPDQLSSGLLLVICHPQNPGPIMYEVEEQQLAVFLMLRVRAWFLQTRPTRQVRE